MSETMLSGYLKAGVAMRRDDRAAAANWARAALAAVDWNTRQSVLKDRNWQVFLDPSLEWMTAYVEQPPAGERMGRIVVNESTWLTLHHDGPAVNAFLNEMRDGCDGIRFLVSDTGPLALAVANQARASGASVTMGKDAITELSERTKSLLIQAASLNAAPTMVDRQIFAVRYAKLEIDLQDLEARMRGLRAEVELAASALFDSTASE